MYLSKGTVCNRAGDGRVSEYLPPQEVYRVSGSFLQDEARHKCETYGGVLATSEQMNAAQATGADWCGWAWQEEKDVISFPTQVSVKCSVGDKTPVNVSNGSGGSFPANCYGVKPPQAQFTDILSFKAGSWNQTEQCPFGHFLATNPNQCYSVCPSGTRPENGACTFPDGVTQNIVRTFKTPIKKIGNLELCSSDEELIDTKCLKRCSNDYMPDNVNCTPNAIKRTLDPTSETNRQTCKPNETLKDGVCIPNCSPGTTLNGLNCVTEGFQASSCTKTSYGQYDKWLCDTEALASSKLKEKLDPNTQVCVSASDNSTTGMYFCESAKDAKNKTGFLKIVQSDYFNSCDKLMKYYIDMSNNLTNIVNAESGMQNGTRQLNDAVVTLDSIYNGIDCIDFMVNTCISNPSNTSCKDPFTKMCVQVKKTRNTVNGNYLNINDNLNSLIPKVTSVTNWRKEIFDLMTTYKCKMISSSPAFGILQK